MQINELKKILFGSQGEKFIAPGNSNGSIQPDLFPNDKLGQWEVMKTTVIKLLGEVAKALKVTPDAIKNFNDEAAINIVANTVTNYEHGAFFNYQPSFNPIDKLIELFEENKKLYERLLQSEKEKVALLKSILNKK